MQLELGSHSVSVEVHDGEHGIATGDHMGSLEKTGKKIPGII
jgi:hypothetical protein